VAWEDALASVRRWFQVVVEGDRWVGVEWEGAKVKVSSVEVLGRQFVAVIGDVFAANILDAQTVLALNHALPIGALENEDGELLLRAMLPLTGLDDVDLRRVVLHVCRQTAHMQSKQSTSAKHPIAFYHYTD